MACVSAARPVRDALARGDMKAAAALLSRPYAISGHVVHGRKLGRQLESGLGAGNKTASGPRTCASRTTNRLPRASLPWVTAWARTLIRALPTSAFGPPSNDAGRVLLEVHCLGGPLGPEGATVKSFAWNCCTNSVMKLATTGWMPDPAAIAADTAAGQFAFWPRTPPNVARPRATRI